MLKNIFAVIGVLYVGQKGYALYREYSALKVEQYWRSQMPQPSKQE